MDEEMMFEMSAGSLEGLPSVGEMFDLTGKVAVVSGTIGLALSVIYRLASCGAKVVFGARRETVGQMAEERLREMGLDVRFHKLDVSSVESCREIVAFAEQTYGTVDIVVPVAAAFFARAFVDIKESEYDHIVDVDQKGQYFLVQAAARSMIRGKKGGKVVTVASVAYRGEDMPKLAMMTAYNTAKAGVVGEGADVTIVAGCGIHNCGDCDSEHDGIHTFYIGKNAKVHYIEKHYGEGEGTGKRILNPQTIVYLEEGASIVMDTSQIGGVDDTKRYTKCEANGANSEVQINEKLLTAGDQHAVSEMDVILNGAGARTRVVSRSVAKEQSTQVFYPRVQGNAPCFGHVSCDSIIMGAAKVRSIPEITCNHVDATLMHEAAIGKIAGEQLLKLETLGLTPEEAEEKILEGFLR